MRTNQRETAIAAYQRHRETGQSSLQRGRVLEFIRAHGGTWSIGELAQALTMQKSTISARVHELVHEFGELHERPKRKDKVSGITVRPVGLPVTQLGLFS